MLAQLAYPNVEGARMKTFYRTVITSIFIIGNHALAQTVSVADSTIFKNLSAHLDQVKLTIAVNPDCKSCKLPVRLPKNDLGVIPESAGLVFQHGRQVGIENHGFGEVKEEITVLSGETFNSQEPYCKIESYTMYRVRDYSFSAGQEFHIDQVKFKDRAKVEKSKTSRFGRLDELNFKASGAFQDSEMFIPNLAKLMKSMLGKPNSQNIEVRCDNLSPDPTFGEVSEIFGTLFKFTSLPLETLIRPVVAPSDTSVSGATLTK